MTSKRAIQQDERANKKQRLDAERIETSEFLLLKPIQQFHKIVDVMKSVPQLSCIPDVCIRMIASMTGVVRLAEAIQRYDKTMVMLLVPLRCDVQTIRSMLWEGMHMPIAFMDWVLTRYPITWNEAKSHHPGYSVFGNILKTGCPDRISFFCDKLQVTPHELGELVTGLWHISEDSKWLRIMQLFKTNYGLTIDNDSP